MRIEMLDMVCKLHYTFFMITMFTGIALGLAAAAVYAWVLHHVRTGSFTSVSDEDLP